MIDLARYIMLNEKKKSIEKDMQLELQRIGYDKELRRLVESGDMDTLAEMAEVMPNTKEKRFLYEAMIKIEDGA
jgi:hypothetical protein